MLPMPDTPNTYRTLTPYLCVPDADAEMRFLNGVRRGRDVVRSQRRRESDHAELTVGDSLVMVGQAGSDWKPLTAALYVWVPGRRSDVCAGGRRWGDVTIGAREQAVRSPGCRRRRHERHHLVDRVANRLGRELGEVTSGWWSRPGVTPTISPAQERFSSTLAKAAANAEIDLYVVSSYVDSTPMPS